jgi:pumilio RNA-binding family
MTPTGMMTPTGIMTPSGAMTPTCHQTNHLSNASTAVPSGVQSPACWADESDDESEGDADEACAELTAQIEAGGVARQAAIEALVGNVTELAFDASACRVVQKAIEFGEEEEVVALSLELQGRVREAIRSPHANHVVQKMVEVLPASSLGFIVEEILGAGAEFARHRYGCRVLCRLVQRQNEESIVHMDELIEELLSDASDLARHTFGHHVIEMVLQAGSVYQRHEIFGSLSSDLMRNAKNRNATYVVERALTSCEDEDRRVLVEELIGTPDMLVSLVENQFGCHVAKALLKISGDTFHKMLSHIEAAAPKLQKSKYGRRLMEELKRIQAC